MPNIPENWDDLMNRSPSQAQRHAVRRSLIRRAHMVQQDGWDLYRCVWSPGDVAATAYLLGDETVLRDTGHDSDEEFLRYYACKLFGINSRHDDADHGLRQTRKWFLAARTHLIS